jgi:hypothetical protein
MDPIPCQKMTHPAKERRRVERFDLRLPARIEELSRGQDRVPVILNVMTKDISACGAFFPSARSFQPGTRVKLDLTLSPQKSRGSEVKRALIQVNGTVLRKEPGGIAVGFDKRYRLTPMDYTPD